MQRKNQWLLLLAGVFPLVVSNMLNYWNDPGLGGWQKAGAALTLWVGISLHWTSVFGISILMQRRFPGRANLVRRISRSFPLGVVAMTVLMMLLDMVLNAINQQEVYSFSFGTLLVNISQSMVTALFLNGLSEAFYQYGQLQQSEKEKEELLRMNLLAQYDSLKQQVNPHFLFNSLNSLSSLISIDPVQAERFVEEMSSVYRYLLQSSREELVSLDRELSFIRSYLHMLQTRFGKAFQVRLDVAERFYPYLIPPLTLQLLVENAVKHNEVSFSRPLTLDIIATPEEKLLVVNNLQRKAIVVPSEKVGLANIMAKYRLLGQADVEVHENQQAFMVTLPLIKKINP